MARALTQKDKLNFLSSLKAGRTISEACRETGVARRTVYYWKDEDQEFSDLWDEAAAVGSDRFEDELRARALDRDDPRSMQALMFLLKKLNPEFKDSFKSETTIHVGGARELDFSKEEIEEAKEILEAAKSKR